MSAKTQYGCVTALNLGTPRSRGTPAIGIVAIKLKRRG
jgi:hypothetical protein